MRMSLQRVHSGVLPRPLGARRFVPAFILGGYGIFILSLALRGVMAWYINPGYIMPTTVAGGVLVGLAAVSLVAHRSGTCAMCGDTCDCGCEQHSPQRLGTYCLLALPLLLALLLPPRGLAAFSANQRGPQIAGINAVRGMASVQRVSLSVDTRAFSMQDWVGALSADPNPRDYAGKTVAVTGMVLHAPASVPPGYIMVMRYLVTCCIADARPVGLIVKDTSNGALKDNQWVTVAGTMASTSQDGQSVAVVKPTSLRVVKSANPYIY